jgi:uncharacterized protein (DUF433 family)
MTISVPVVAGTEAGGRRRRVPEGGSLGYAGAAVSDLGAYRPAEAARYAGTTTATVARWFRGYAAPGHRMAPVLPRSGVGLLSFAEMVEVAFVADFRRLGMALERLRQAHDYLRATLEVAHPFAQLRFRSDGAHLLAPFGDELVAADAAGQLAWASPIAERLDQFDYAGEVVCRWWPRGRAGGVAIDPGVGFGAPVVSGTGVPTRAVRERCHAGDSVGQVAEDLALTREQVAAALTFEEGA